MDNVIRNTNANRGIPAGDCSYMAPLHATSPPYSGAEQSAPACPEFDPNPVLGAGLPDWPCQTPSNVMRGIGFEEAAAEPGSSSQFSNRWEKVCDRWGGSDEEAVRQQAERVRSAGASLSQPFLLPRGLLWERYAAGLDRAEHDLLSAVGDMNGYESDPSFTHVDIDRGSPTSWIGYSAGGHLHGFWPSLKGL